MADSALMYKLRLELIQFLLLSLREKTKHYQATLPRRELESSIPARRPGSCQQSCAFADSAIAVPVKYGCHLVADYLRPKLVTSSCIFRILDIRTLKLAPFSGP